MKIITETYKVFTFDELTQEAKDKAREDFNQYDDFTFLRDDLREYLHEGLTELQYTHDEITPLYSLSHSQGDGLMFEGSVTDKDGNTFSIKHYGHYHHEQSTSISGEDKEGEEIDTEDFENNVYIPLCKSVRDRGYEIIDYNQSEENFSETCDANEYTFLENGTMKNAKHE